MILEEEPKGVLLYEKKLTKVLHDSSKHSSERRLSQDDDTVTPLPVIQVNSKLSISGGGDGEPVSGERKVHDQAILELDEMPSLDLPSEMKPASFHRIKL